MVSKIGEYKNGNYTVTIFNDGTKVRSNDLTFFQPEFPESIDIKITNRCDINCPFCFPSYTNVLLYDEEEKIEYSTNISNVHIGDLVVSYDTINNKVKYQKVTNIFRNEYRGKLIAIEDTLGNILTCTPNHKIFTDIGFVRADMLVEDDELFMRNKNDISFIKKINTTLYNGIVYNLEVEGVHNYFAEKTLVHNCHEDSNKKGKHGNIMNVKFLETLHPYTELAIGGGNPLSHPDLISFLKKCKELKVIPSVTINQKHFLSNLPLVKELVDDKLIYGLGVSLTKVNKELIDNLTQFPNSVIHVIAGIVDVNQLKELSHKGLKVLVLGYKQFRRGQEVYAIQGRMIEDKIRELSNNLQTIIDEEWFKVISFDNLAIRQLDIKSKLSKEEYEEFFMGDDGFTSMYVDLVDEKFSKSSTAVERYPLLDDINEMFKVVRI